MRRELLCLLVLATACGSPARITLGTPSFKPTLLYVDTGDGWFAPARIANGEYVFSVDSTFEAAAVCVGNDGSITSLDLRATRDDGTEWTLSPSNGSANAACATLGPTEPPPTLFAVTGVLRQPGEVNVGSSGRSCTNPSCSYRIDVAGGLYDLLAVDRTGGRSTKFVARRELQIEADSAQSDIDFAAEGGPLQSRTIAVEDVQPNDNLSVYVNVRTSHGTIRVTNNSLASDTDVQYLAPDSLQADDLQSLEVFAERPGISRFIDASFNGEAKPVTFAPSTTVEFSATTLAKWTPISGAYDRVRAVVTQSGDPHEVRQEVTATHGWVDSTGDNQLIWRTDIPGYDATWQVDPAGSANSFSVIRDSDGVFRETTMNEP